MTSIDDLRQLLEDDYLEPVTERTPETPLASGVNTTDQTFTLTTGVLSPDEDALIGPGSVLEVGYELVFVTDYDGTDATVTRNYRNSGAAAHAAGDMVRIPTRWPRRSQEQAIREAIAALYQPLFVVKEIFNHSDAMGWVPLPLTAVAVVDVLYQGDDNRWDPAEAELFPTHPLQDTMAAVQLQDGLPSVMCRVRYGERIEAPTDRTATIEDLPQTWERIVLLDAAAALMSGVDVDAITQEVLTETLRLERFPVRSGESIVNSMVRMREYLVGRYESEQRGQTPKQVRIVDTVYADL